MRGRAAVLAVWAALPGCVVSVGDKPSPTPPSAAEPPPAREFASMRPGEYRPAHPELAAEVPPKPVDPPPVLKPPAEFVTALVPPDSPVVAAVRSLEADRPPATDLPPAVVPLLAAALATSRGAGPAAVGEAVRQLDAAAALLAPQAPLAVAKAVFCRRVRGFGLYDPLPTDRPTYPANKKETVLVYLELRNVQPRPDGDRYQWRPKATWVVRDQAGQAVDQRAEDLTREPTRSPSREGYVGVWFAAPERAGTYTVTVSVAEPAADGRGVSREVSKTLTFFVK